MGAFVNEKMSEWTRMSECCKGNLYQQEKTFDNHFTSLFIFREEDLSAVQQSNLLKPLECPGIPNPDKHLPQTEKHFNEYRW